MRRWSQKKRSNIHHLPPFCYVSGGLEEAGVVVLLQALLRLRDEGAGALQTLATVGNLLRQLAKFHHLQAQKHRSESEPERWFLLRLLFCAYLLKLQI